MLGWQFAHNRRTLQDAYGQAASCTGSKLQKGDCVLAHAHATITETSCASTGWTFLAEPNEPIKVAVVGSIAFHQRRWRIMNRKTFPQNYLY